MTKRLIGRLIDEIKPWDSYKLGKSTPLSRNWFRERLIRLYFWSNRQRAIRYIPVLKALKSTVKPQYPILEIGSGCLGLALYTSNEVIGVDKNTSGPRLPNMTLINCSALNLPFPDNSFDLVCSLDMLEHLPANTRQRAVMEICRVARKMAIISVPCGAKTRKWEEKARKHYVNLLKKYEAKTWEKSFLIKHNQYLFEHLQYGLPEISDIHKYINAYEHKMNTQCSVRVTGNESHYVWYLGSLGYMSLSYFKSIFTTLFFTAFFPLIYRIGFGGYYRKVFFIDKRKKPNS